MTIRSKEWTKEYEEGYKQINWKKKNIEENKKENIENNNNCNCENNCDKCNCK